VSAWATVVAALGGTTLGLLGGMATEQLRYRRAAKERWLDERRDLFVALIYEARSVVEAGQQWRFHHNHADPSVDEMHAEYLDAAEAVLQRRSIEIGLIASGRERDAATQLAVAAMGYARGGGDDYARSWRDAEVAFREAARAGLAAGD